MNRQPFHTPPRWWAPRLSTQLIQLLRPVRRHTLRRKQRLVEIHVSGIEGVKQALASGMGVMITPNHSFHYDSYVLMEAAHEFGRPVHIMTAWQVFAMSKRWEQWLLQRHGCFSIDRENSDTQAFKQAVEILRESRHPLVIFPEGDIYHTNDRVTPFREGAAAVAFSAARKAQRPIVCVPCALKCWYLDDPTPALHRTLDELERRLMWRPRSDLSIAERIYRFAEGLLALKEVEYLGQTQPGSLDARITALADALLARLEAHYQLQRRDLTVPERVKELRRTIIRRNEQPQLSAQDRARLSADMEDLFVVIQLYSYPGNYAAQRPSIERLAETVDKLEEDVLEATYPTVRGRRRAEVWFGPPIDVPREKAQQNVEAFTQLLEGEVQRLLDQANAARGSQPGR
jgi:1-acyl-sn-glycerol-3-phosphate acyltransferase